MSILAELTDLCAAFPACRAVAYCDLMTGMVLCSSTRIKTPQEQLDQLGQTATDLLDSDFMLAGPTQNAVLVQGGDIWLVLRSATQPTEALCCECSLDIDLDRLLHHAARILAEISGLT